jgi:predicted dehydrogenase
MQLRTAVIGVGYLGKFHAEKLAALPDVQLVAVVDTDAERRARVAEACGAQAIADYRELFGKVDAVCIAVPTPLHHQIAGDFLSLGTHVLVEKPVTETVAQAKELVEIAEAGGVVLQVGHLERFNPAVTALRERVSAPRFIEAYRVAPFKERGLEVDVILDLMIHDIDIAQALVGAPVEQVRANGTAVFSDKPDIANARLEFAGGCVANLTASRVSLKTERSLRLFQPDAYLSADLHARRLKVYRTRAPGAGGRWPEIEVEEIESGETDPLRAEIEAFVASIRDGQPPAVSGREALGALATAIRIAGMVAHPPRAPA